MTPRKRNKVEAKETMLLVCAKESEAVFFSQMRKDCRYSNLTVIAEESSSLEKFIDAAAKERNRGKYSVCWALFGFNDVATDVEEVKSMMDYADKKKVNLCYFNPTFDLYFMLFATKPRAFICSKYCAVFARTTLFVICEATSVLSPTNQPEPRSA